MIKIEKKGNGNKALLFVHGIYGSYRHFSFLYPLTPEDVSYRAIELKGHEGTVKEFSKARMDDWRQDVKDALTDYLTEGKDIEIVAHSMGTLLAIEAALRYPQIKRLFLLNLPVYWTFKASNVKPYLEVLFDAKNKSEMALSMQKASDLKLSKNLFAYASFLPSLAELDQLIRQTRKGIQNFKTPSVVFLSSHDELVGKRSEKALAKYPDVFKVCKLTTSGHFAYSEPDQKRIEEEFVSFLKE